MKRPRFQFLTLVVAVCAVGSLFAISPSRTHGQGDAILRIGATNSLSPPDWTTAQEKAALVSLQRFIHEQTGFSNVITHEKSWHVVLDKMTRGQQQLGVFPGHEFAWALKKCPKLRPVALAVNGLRYQEVSLVTHSSSKAIGFSSIQGHSLALPPSGQNLARLFVQREAKAVGKKADDFFSKIVSPENVEDALDDVVDGLVQAAAVDRIGLEAYQRRKPGRSRKLKEIARSQPFPPVVLACYDKGLDAQTLRRFREGLLNANRKQKGEILLTLFRLTRFEDVPKDFAQVLNVARKTFPPDDGAE